MRFIERYCQLSNLNNLIRLPLAVVSLFLLASCGGSTSSTAKKVVDPVVIIQEEVAQTLTHAEREYRLLSFDELDNTSIQPYWSNDNEILASDKASLKLIITQLLTLFNEQHFAFSQPASADSTSDYKRLIVSPTFVTGDDSAVVTSLIDENTIELFFSDAQQLESPELLTELIIAFYQSERLRYQQDKITFHRLVTRGLALHFLQQNLVEADFSFDIDIEQNELNQALAQLKSEADGFVMSEDWFAEPVIADQVLANAVGYYLVAQHFSFYVGSTASNSFSLDSQLFLPWLSSSNLAIKKTHQYVRTNDVADQISVSELSRQANLYVGSYFIEGLNHEKLIALSFDDGPSQYTSQILDVLEQAEVTASFFWQGQSLVQYSDVVERSIAAGHTVANHSWNHANGMAYTPDDLWQKQVLNTNQEFQKHFKVTPRFYRPPYGEITDEQVAFLARKGMKVLLWSVDSRDWNPTLNSVEQIETELISHQHEEAITLMHDAGGNRQNTVDALPAIIEHYKEQGYRFVNLETLLGISDKH